MARFWISFSGYCSVNADSVQEAEETFWKNLPRPSDKIAALVFTDVDEVEGEEEEK